MVLLHYPKIRAASALTLFSVTLAGCQTWEPRPLDPDGHRAAWLARTANDEDIAAFARRLAEEDPDARTFDVADGVDRADAEIVALVYNPDLRLARLRAGVAAAGAEHAGRWADPEFSIDILRLTDGGSNPWIIGPRLAFTIPLSGRLDAERDRASAARDAALLRAAEAEWRVRRDVRTAWADWSAARRKRDETDRLIGALEEIAALADRLRAAGELPRTEAGLFHIELAMQRQTRRRLDSDTHAAALEIRRRLGLAPDAPLDLRPTLAPVELPAEVDLADAALARSLESARLAAEYNVAEQTLRREIRKQYPDLTLGPLYEDDEGQSKIGLLAGVPVPILNRNVEAIETARAERELARAAYETARERLVGELAAERARLAARRAERVGLAEVIAPLVDQQIADTRELLELGEGDGRSLLESLVRAHTTRLQIIDVRRDEAVAAASLAWLIGPDPIAVPPASELPPADGEVTP